MNELKKESIDVEKVYNRISNLIEKSKNNIVVSVNREMTMLYWNIGKDITENVLNNPKAEYGDEVIKKVSKRLVIEYGR